MKHPILFILMLAAASFACTVELVTPTPGSIPTSSAELEVPTPELSTEVPTVRPTKVLAPPEDDIYSPAALSVTVAYQSVNLRNRDYSSTGETVSSGQVLAVICSDDGYCQITNGDHAGLYIWRGCTSDPGEYSCMTANR